MYLSYVVHKSLHDPYMMDKKMSRLGVGLHSTSKSQKVIWIGARRSWHSKCFKNRKLRFNGPMSHEGQKLYRTPKKSENSIWKLKTTPPPMTMRVLFSDQLKPHQLILLRPQHQTVIAWTRELKRAWRHWIEAWRWFESLLLRKKRPDKFGTVFSCKI